MYSGNFIDAHSFDKVSGRISVFEQGSKQIVRFEDFEATNGPDQTVYLATDTSAEDFVSLGKLKGNIGAQNYDIPSGIDLETYDTALIWCEQFGVLFGSAELAIS